MTTREIGTRIGAFLGAAQQGKTVQFLGYGTYQGDEVPPETIGGLNVGRPNPKLALDNGKVVWGCECWWGPEEAIKRRVQIYTDNGWTVETVDIDAARAEAAKETATRQ